MRSSAGIAIAAALLCGACGSSGTTSVAETVTGSTTAATSTPSSSAEATGSTSSGPSTAPVGTELANADVRITVLDIRDPVKSVGTPGSGGRWVGSLVQACYVGTSTDAPTSVYFTWGPWAVVGSDGGRYPASSSSYDDFPRPVYPQSELDGRYARGECAKGWIVYPVNAGVAPSTIRYTRPVDGTTLTWQTGK